MLRTTRAFVGSILAIACLSGCAEAERESEPKEVDDGPLSVFVVNYPLQYFAERIGGEHVEVVFPAPSGPTRAKMQPRQTSSEKSRSAFTVP